MVTNISRKLLAAALAFAVLGSMSSQQLVAMKRLRDTGTNVNANIGANAWEEQHGNEKRRRVDEEAAQIEIDDTTIQLQSDDGAEPKTVSKRILIHSVTLKDMLNDLAGVAPQGPITLPNTSNATLNNIVACLKLIDEKGKEAGEFLDNYVKTLSPQELHQLAISANYLDIQPLLDATTKELGSYYSSDEGYKMYMKLQAQYPMPLEVRQLCTQNLSYFPELQGWLLNQVQPITLNGHNKRVAMEFCSSNGKTLVSLPLDMTIKLWDFATGKHIKTLEGHTNFVEAVCFSSDGTTLASGSHDNTIKLWDVATGQCIKTLEGYSWCISICFSADGKIIASGLADQTIKLWDVATGECIKTHWCYAKSICFSPNGKTLATGSYDNTIKLWEKVNGLWTCIKTLKGHKSTVNSVHFSPDGKILASGSWDETIKLWDVATGKCVTTLNGHKNFVNLVCISPDGKTLTSVSDDKTMKLWDIGILSLLKSLILEQAKFLNLVCKTLDAGQAFYLNQDDLHAMFKSLPEGLRKVLLKLLLAQKLG